MGVMRATAVRLLDGREADLGRALTLEVGAALSSPAQSMRGTFSCAQFPGDLGSVRVWEDDYLLFEGKVDHQSSVLSAKGSLLEIEARSRGALLLDNEAAPCTLSNVHLTAVFNLCIAPYGFVCYNPNPTFTLAQYTVRKDTSEWEALCGFTRRAWGITPYVVGEQVMVDKPRPHNALVISNTEDGLPFTRLEVQYTPYKMLSKVVLRDAYGNYSASMENSSAAYHGVQRKRYVIPSNEFVDSPALDANQRIRRSMRDSGLVVATLPGIHPVQLGQEVRVADRAVEKNNLLVDEWQYTQGETGVFTRLWLKSSLYS